MSRRRLAWALLFALRLPAAAPADAEASAGARRLLEWLAGLSGRAEKGVVSGQFTAFPRWIGYEYPRVIGRLIEETGRTPALLAADYGATLRDPQDDDLGETSRLLLDWWEQGGLVTVSWHARNPWTGGSSWDRGSIDLAGLLTPGSQANRRWMRDLDRIAAALAGLRDSGVTVLWRPFHEMNGAWFWWGRAEPKQFAALWRHMFHYFTVEKGLHHLLWVYSASSGAHRRQPAQAYYPGDSFCDIVGLDNYSDDLAWHGYDELVAIGKPFAATEFGPDQTAGSFDYARLIAAIRERYPRTVYFVCWGTQWALIHNRNARALLDDPRVIRREDLPRR